jgi:hypothetical protein
MDIGPINENLRAVSKQMFGKLYRLEIAAVAAAEEPPTWSRRLANRLRLPENQVATELGNFVEIGALQRFPAEHDRRKIYQAVSHPIWRFSHDLLEKTIRDTSPDGDGDKEVSEYWTAVLDGEAPRSLSLE